MSINRDKFGALLFLCLALIYGFYVDDIPLLFGDEDAPFNAQTLPNALAWILGLVSFIQLVMPANQEADGLLWLYHSLSRLPDLDHDFFGRRLCRSWRTPDQGFAGCIHPRCFHFLVPTDPTDGHLSGTG